MKPLCIDGFCGLGGWSAGFLAEGWDCIGFDLERHVYGAERYPGQLVLQDILTVHGSQFRDASCLVFSPPCQEYSYMAMPWTRAKLKAKLIRDDESGQALIDLNRLFNACFRIQREASEAAGRHIPMVVENVRGAQPWVGRARWNFGSFYLWGDVPALMPITLGRQPKVTGVGSWSDYGKPAYVPKAFNGTAARQVAEGTKVPGVDWHNYGKPGYQKPSFRDSVKVGNGWFGEGNDCSPMRQHSSKSSGRKSSGRKFASAMIAKIPLALSRHIARVYRPDDPILNLFD